MVSVESTKETDRKLGKLIKKEKGVDNIKQSFRIQGIPEDHNKTKSENLVPTTDEVHEILSEIGVRPEVKELKRLGEFKRERKKPRTLLVTFANEHEARLALAKSIEHREELAKRNIYLLPALSKEDALKENAAACKSKTITVGQVFVTRGNDLSSSSRIGFENHSSGFSTNSSGYYEVFVSGRYMARCQRLSQSQYTRYLGL